MSNCGNGDRNQVSKRDALGGGPHGRRCSAAGGPGPTPGLEADGLGLVSGLRVSGAAPLGSEEGPRLDNEESSLP